MADIKELLTQLESALLRGAMPEIRGGNPREEFAKANRIKAEIIQAFNERTK